MAMIAPVITPRMRDSRLLLSVIDQSSHIIRWRLEPYYFCITILKMRQPAVGGTNLRLVGDPGNTGDDDMADNDADNSTDVQQDALAKEKSFFARGALLGLVGGALAAVIFMGAAGTVISLTDNVFGSSTAAAANDEPVVVDPVVARGESLASTNGCAVCHSTNGVDGTGPTWKGLGEKRDEAYLRQSIVDPNADIVAGFSPDIMPQTFGDTLTDDDISALIAYIQSL
jgi:mono/diheme cytochrome c family protein